MNGKRIDLPESPAGLFEEDQAREKGARYIARG
jgi:hypothetical protein